MKKSILLFTALMFSVAISKAQTIPNASFESWTNMGTYSNPDGWDQLNVSTASMSKYTCEKGTPGSVGNAYLKLTSKTIGSMGVVPGICVSGKINQTTMKPESGFAYNNRPTSLTGKWQHMIYGNSQGFIQITFTRWDAGINKQIPVGSGMVTLSGMAMSWANFSIPISYIDNNNPDSCIIVMSASGNSPTDKDYLWLDNLTFSGTTGINNLDKSIIELSVFPNPTNEILNVNVALKTSQVAMIQLIDLRGKVVLTNNLEMTNGMSNQSISIKDFDKGTYLLKVVSDENSEIKKIIIE